VRARSTSMEKAAIGTQTELDAENHHQDESQS
jgi:hypothetical protein